MLACWTDHWTVEMCVFSYYLHVVDNSGQNAKSVSWTARKCFEIEGAIAGIWTMKRKQKDKRREEDIRDYNE